MGTKISTLFLFAVLILGVASYPNANFNSNTFDDSFQISSSIAFAQSDSENDDEERDDDDDHDEERDDDDDHDEERDDDDDHDEERDDDEKDEIEIEVEVKGDTAKVKVKFDGDKHRFLVTDDTSESAIIDAILNELPDFPLDKAGIMELWEFEVEDEERDDDESTTLTTTEFDAYESQQDSQELYDNLLQQIAELEERIQTLLEKYESGEYYGIVPKVDSEIKSYTISFAGSAISQDDDSVSTMQGEIYLDSLITDSSTSKYAVTGGEISIDDEFYDFVFGKVRVTSSGNVMLIGQVMNWADENDDSSTIKLVISSNLPLEGGFGSESLDIEILPQSKIAGQWHLSGLGTLS